MHKTLFKTGSCCYCVAQTLRNGLHRNFVKTYHFIKTLHDTSRPACIMDVYGMMAVWIKRSPDKKRQLAIVCSLQRMTMSWDMITGGGKHVKPIFMLRVAYFHITSSRILLCQWQLHCQKKITGWLDSRSNIWEWKGEKRFRGEKQE